MKAGSIGIAISVAAMALLAFGADTSTEALIRAGHWKQVRAIAERMALEKPNDSYTFYLQAEVKQAFGDDDAALPLAEKAVALDGNNALYHLCLAEIYGDMAQHAGIFKQIGLARSFKSEAEKAVSLDAKNLDARSDLVQFYLDAPGIVGGGKDKAYAEADKIARISAAKGFMAQAQIAAHQKDLTKQQSFNEKAAQADPADYDANFELAALYLSAGQHRYEDAERLALQAVKIAPDRIGAYEILGNVYASQQRWKELDEVFVETKKNDPDDSGAFYQAGKALLLKGDALPRAEQYFREYMNQEPEAGEPSLAVAHWRLANVLEKENRKSDAVAELQTALTIQPDFADAKKDLKRLK
jgi:tetratricopeptide (TPR) repeat protein